METITIKLKKTKKGWKWERKGTDGIHDKSGIAFDTASQALYNAYAQELRSDDDKPITKESV